MPTHNSLFSALSVDKKNRYETHSVTRTTYLSLQTLTTLKLDRKLLSVPVQIDPSLTNAYTTVGGTDVCGGQEDAA